MSHTRRGSAFCSRGAPAAAAMLLVGLLAGSCMRLGFGPTPDGGPRDGPRDGASVADGDALGDQMTTPYRVELTLASSGPVVQGACRQVELAVKDQGNQLATLPAAVQTLLSVDVVDAGLFADPACLNPTSTLALASQATVFFSDSGPALVRSVTVAAAPQHPEVASGSLVVQTRAPATAVAAGIDNTCAVAGGTPQCWGGNSTGELGNGTRTGRLAPAAVGGGGSAPSGVVSIATSGLHTCAATAAGAVYCWGRNGSGQLGDGSKTVRLSPVQVSGLADVTQVGVGYLHSCALLGGGAVLCWGNDWAGQLGNGPAGSSAKPAPVIGLSGVVQLGVGCQHACAVLTGGSIACWGNNSAGQLGNGDKLEQQAPVAVKGLGGAASSVAAGCSHTCAVVDGGVQCWGANWTGQLGTGAGSTVSPTWVKGLGSGSGVTALAVGTDHSCAAVQGGLRCWGYNRHGQLGDGTFVDRDTPVVVNGVAQPTHLAAAEDHTCAVSDGLVQCWGRADAGQLGRGQPLSSAVPLQVKGTGQVSGGAGGDGFTCALQSGSVHCWGSNWSGQLGDGTEVTRASPKPVSQLGACVEVACGQDHACAIASGGDALWCWGNNSQGELGSSSPGASGTPLQVSGLAGLKTTQVASYDRHSCAVTTDGIRCWGRNNNGQLGDGTTDSSFGPVKVQNLASPATAVTTGYESTCAAASGKLACWGRNVEGQCATGSPGGLSSTPQVCPAPLGQVSAVTAGQHFGCAVVGTRAMCWGSNERGEVGDKSFESRSLPVEVQGLASTATVTRVAAGAHHACALADGAVWCWGQNASGQLGDGSRSTSAQAVQVSGLPGAVSQIFAGHAHSCAVAGGQLWCWGSNALGELGEPWTGPVGPGPVAAWQAP